MEGLFDNVTIKDSNLSLSSFSRSRWKSVAFVACDLTSADMSEMQISQVRFQDCSLIGSAFFRTDLLGVDLSTCRIDGIVVSESMGELKGAKMDLYQSAEFVRKLGILLAE